MNKIVYGIATCGQPQWEECVGSWHDTASTTYPHRIVRRREILDAYQSIYSGSAEPVIAYLHDDLAIQEKDWDFRVLREFDDPTVGLVGFGGAAGHGHPMMYRQPYRASSLARVGFASNMRNAEAHGARFAGERDVAVLDGMALFVRRGMLDKVGGWKVPENVGYFGYDYWVCCMARRLGYRIRLVGVECEHLGGKSTGLNPDLKADFEGAHRAIYEEFRDVLPWEMK